MNLPQLRAELKEKAGKATEGPWAYEATGTQSNEWCLGQVLDESDSLLSGRIDEGRGEVVELVCENGSASDFNDAEYIALANPANIQALLTALSEAEEAMRGVLRVADRETVEFRALRAALEKIGVTE